MVVKEGAESVHARQIGNRVYSLQVEQTHDPVYGADVSAAKLNRKHVVLDRASLKQVIKGRNAVHGWGAFE
jgi:hypothetical protein